MQTDTLTVLLIAYRAAAVRAELPEATAADHAAWLAAQRAYYAAGGRDPVDGWRESEAEIVDLTAASLQKVRTIQKTAKSLRHTYLRPTDDRAAIRDAAQYANDCCFRNAPPGASAEQKERWAGQWLARYEAKLAALRERPPLPSGWRWDRGELTNSLNEVAAMALASGRFALWDWRNNGELICRGQADAKDLDAAMAAAEKECWKRSLFETVAQGNQA